MNGLNNGFGATPQGFSSVSMDELMQVEGGLFGISWSDVKKAAKYVAGVVGGALVTKAANKI